MVCTDAAGSITGWRFGLMTGPTFAGSPFYAFESAEGWFHDGIPTYDSVGFNTMTVDGIQTATRVDMTGAADLYEVGGQGSWSSQDLGPSGGRAGAGTRHCVTPRLWPHTAGVGTPQKTLEEMTVSAEALSSTPASPPLAAQRCHLLRYSPSRLTLEWGGSC